MRNEKYIAEINKALLSFQMIEEGLKICVGLSYEIISATAPYPITSDFLIPYGKTAPFKENKLAHFSGLL